MQALHCSNVRIYRIALRGFYERGDTELQTGRTDAARKMTEAIIAKLLEIGALGDGDFIAAIRARK